MSTLVRARSAAWLLAAALLAGSLAGSLAGYNAGTTVLASVIGAVVLAGVERRTMTGRVASLAAALLLSFLPWGMTLAIQSGKLDPELLAISLVPFGLGLLLLMQLPFAAGRPRHAVLAVPTFAITAAAIIWLAFGTNYGYFCLNVGRLEALAVALASTPAIHSLSLGTNDRGERGYEFDDYRFVNGVLVTHYPGQARPDQQQPKVYIDDELRALDVPRERYDAMRRLMTRSETGFVARDPANGQVTMTRVGFDNEWDPFLIYVPGNGSPGSEVAVLSSPRRHWYWVSHY